MNWAYVAGAGLLWLVTTGLTWLVAARITNGILLEQNRHFKKTIHGIIEDVHELNQAVQLLKENLAGLKTDRVRCELNSARRYSTRAEIARLISDQTTQHYQLMSKLDELSGAMHGRITKVETGLAEMRGQRKGANDGPVNAA